MNETQRVIHLFCYKLFLDSPKAKFAVFTNIRANIDLKNIFRFVILFIIVQIIIILVIITDTLVFNDKK